MGGGDVGHGRYTRLVLVEHPVRQVQDSATVTVVGPGLPPPTHEQGQVSVSNLIQAGSAQNDHDAPGGGGGVQVAGRV